MTVDFRLDPREDLVPDSAAGHVLSKIGFQGFRLDVSPSLPVLQYAAQPSKFIDFTTFAPAEAPHCGIG